MNDVELKIAEIAAQVTENRKLLKLTQAELAELAQVSPTFVFELENGKQTVSLNRVISVCLAVGLKLELRVRTDD
jgi:y4mF family transcriptional regulator